MIGPHGAADADDIAAAVEEALDTTINQLRVLGLGGAVSALGFASLSMALIGMFTLQSIIVTAALQVLVPLHKTLLKVFKIH
jgi:hypothetical protein